jgi:hypothetical protein
VKKKCLSNHFQIISTSHLRTKGLIYFQKSIFNENRFGILNFATQNDHFAKVERFVLPKKQRSRVRVKKVVALDKSITESDCQWIQKCLLPKEIKSPFAQPNKPTHFLSLRIRNLTSKFQEFQKTLKTKNPKTRNFLIPPAKFHVTIGVLDLARPGTMKAALLGNAHW